MRLSCFCVRDRRADHSLRLFEYLPIGTPETKHSAIYYLENCAVVPYSTDVRPCCFTLKMRNGAEIRFALCGTICPRPALFMRFVCSLSAESERSRVAWIQTFVEASAARLCAAFPPPADASF
jgi:hypothetical protein